MRNRSYVKPMATTNEIPHALPPFEVVDALIKMRANADTLIEYGGMRNLDVLRRLTDAPLPPVPQTDEDMHKTREW